MPLYATEQQFRDWTGDQSAEVTPRQLAAASRFIAAATRGAVYDVDSLTGLPTGASTLQALQDATCELLAHRAPAAEAGELVGLKRASIGGATYELAEATVQAAADTAGGMPLDVHLILVEAGLVGGYVLVDG